MQSSGHGNRSNEDSEIRMGREHTIQMTSQQPEPVEQQGHNPRNRTARSQTQTPLLLAANSMQLPSQSPPIPPSLQERLQPDVNITLLSNRHPTLLRRNESIFPCTVPLQPQNPPVLPRSNKNLLPVGIQSAFKSPSHSARQKHLLPAVNSPLDTEVALIFPKSNEGLQLSGKRQLDAHQTVIPPRFKASVLPVNNLPESRSAHILPKPRSQLPAVSTSQESQRLPIPATCGNINAEVTVEVSIKVGSQESHILCSGSKRPRSPIQVQIIPFNMPLTSRQEKMVLSAANAVLQKELWHTPSTRNARPLIMYNAPPHPQQHVTLPTRRQRSMAAVNTTVQFQHRNVLSKSTLGPPHTNMLSSTSSSNTSIQRLPLIPNLEHHQANMQNPFIRPNVTRSIQSSDSTAIQYRELPPEMNNPNFFLCKQEPAQRSISIEPSYDQEVPCKSQEEVNNSKPVTEEQVISHQDPQETSLSMLQALTVMEQNMLSEKIRLYSQEQKLLSQELALAEERRLLSQKLPLCLERSLRSHERCMRSHERRPLSQKRRPRSQERRPRSQERRPRSQERRPRSRERRRLSRERRPLSPEKRPLSPERRPLSQERRPRSQERRPRSQERRPLSLEEALSQNRRPLSLEEALSQNRRPLTLEQISPRTMIERLQRYLMSEEAIWDETSSSNSPPGIRTEDLSKYNRTSRRMAVRHRRTKETYRRLYRCKSEKFGKIGHTDKRGKRIFVPKPKGKNSSEEASGYSNSQSIPSTESSNSIFTNRGSKSCQIANINVNTRTSSTTISQLADNAAIKHVDEVDKMKNKAKRKLIFDSEITRKSIDSNTCGASLDQSVSKYMKQADKRGKRKITSKPNRKSSSEGASGNYNLQRILSRGSCNSGLEIRGSESCQIAKDDVDIGTNSPTNSQRAGTVHIKQRDGVNKMIYKAKRKLTFDFQAAIQSTDSNTCEASFDQSTISKLSTSGVLYDKERVRNRINNLSNQNYEEKTTENSITRYSVRTDVQKVRKAVTEKRDSKGSGYEICERETPGTADRTRLALIDAKYSDDRKKNKSYSTRSSS